VADDIGAIVKGGRHCGLRGGDMKFFRWEIFCVQRHTGKRTCWPVLCCGVVGSEVGRRECEVQVL